MANTTARPSGVKRYLAGPSRKTTEANTQLMASVETMVGTAIPAEPCRVACGRGIAFLGEQAVGVLDRHGRVVDQDADGERKTAERHRVERLAEEVQRDERRQDGQRDRDHHDHASTAMSQGNSRIIRAVSPAAIAPSRSTPSTDDFTNTD